MRLLLDTHMLLWVTDDHPALEPKARQLILSADAVFFSAVSIWEVAIKSKLGRLRHDAAAVAHQARTDGMLELPVRAFHAEATAALPLLHGDPFDRLLVAQSASEPLTLLTNDRKLAAYGPHVLLA